MNTTTDDMPTERLLCESRLEVNRLPRFFDALRVGALLAICTAIIEEKWYTID